MRDTVLIGDYIVQMFVPKELTDKENSLHKKIKKIGDFDSAELHKFFWEKHKWITVIVYRNSYIADQIRKETEAHFK